MAKIDRALKIKRNLEAQQHWVSIPLSAKLCKKCIHAYPDTEYTIGAEKANCNMFEPPEDKPVEVLQGTADCDFYEER